MSGADIPLLELEGLEVHFGGGGRTPGSRRRVVRAVDGIDLTVRRGETLGVVGESGSGKSTLGRAIVGVHANTGGTLRFEGAPVSTRDSGLKVSATAVSEWRRSVQMVFQDPFDALNPRMRVRDSILEPLVARRWGDRAARDLRLAELLAQVGLEQDVADRFPHEFSGGQLQRVVIARAIALRPALIVCDEPTSALDVSTQAIIVNLLKDLQEELGLTYVFISHDLGVVRQIADRVAVMYGGRIVEQAPSADFFAGPLHPYAAGLMAAVPGRTVADSGRRLILAGDPHDPASEVAGCRFAPRCPFATELCRTDDIGLHPAGPGRAVACHHWSRLRDEQALIRGDS
jgi:oligopeptide transport system ATP-binding protein